MDASNRVLDGFKEVYNNELFKDTALKGTAAGAMFAVCRLNFSHGLVFGAVAALGERGLRPVIVKIKDSTDSTTTKNVVNVVGNVLPWAASAAITAPLLTNPRLFPKARSYLLTPFRKPAFAAAIVAEPLSHLYKWMKEQ